MAEFALFFSICPTGVPFINSSLMDSKILGKRLRMIRKYLEITQTELAAATNLTQSVISRLENGEEVYASVLLSVLSYYQSMVSLDHLFSAGFENESNLQKSQSKDLIRLKIYQQLNTISDIINSASETSLAQIDRLKKELL